MEDWQVIAPTKRACSGLDAEEGTVATASREGENEIATSIPSAIEKGIGLVIVARKQASA